VLGARRMGGGLWSCGIRILAAALLAVCEGMGEDDEHNDDYDGDHGDYDGDADDADDEGHEL